MEELSNGGLFISLQPFFKVHRRVVWICGLHPILFSGCCSTSDCNHQGDRYCTMQWRHGLPGSEVHPFAVTGSTLKEFLRKVGSCVEHELTIRRDVFGQIW